MRTLLSSCSQNFQKQMRDKVQEQTRISRRICCLEEVNVELSKENQEMLMRIREKEIYNRRLKEEVAYLRGEQGSVVTGEDIMNICDPLQIKTVRKCYGRGRQDDIEQLQNQFQALLLSSRHLGQTQKQHSKIELSTLACKIKKLKLSKKRPRQTLY